MTAAQPPLLLAQPHRNHQLFSDYYLNTLLPRREDWQALVEPAGPVMQRVAEIIAAYRPSPNEAQLERELVRPVLEALGHTFEVQAALRTPDGAKRPDYVFYRDQATLDANKGATLTDALLQASGLAVGDAKAWNSSLDVALRGSADPFSNKNPSYQIGFYIQHSGVEWGILTNGQLWRLYHRDTAHKQDRYYEVDLPALIDAGSVAAFLYFFAFFHRSAFEPQPLGVRALLDASGDYARGVGNSLKAQVFDALRHIAQGFLDYAPNGLQPDPPALKAIYDSSLILLYRLLFVFYAEARDLLPLRDSTLYRDRYSLYALTREVERDLRTGAALLPNTAILWPRLAGLFTIVDRGHPQLRVTTFNGGLFDPRRHPFLERHLVGDGHVPPAA
jgi:hypothetical protein